MTGYWDNVESVLTDLRQARDADQPGAARAASQAATAKALLMLVEQQRVANLVALTKADGVARYEALGALFENHETESPFDTDPERTPLRLRHEIAAALGLDGGQE